MGTLYPEMSAHERAVDFYIELLRKDQLDENVPIETIEKCLNYFQHIYPLHMGQSGLLNYGQVLADCLKSYHAGMKHFEISTCTVGLVSKSLV